MTAATTPRRTTEPFREEHVAIKEHLRHMSQMIQSIPGGVPKVQKHSMTKLVEALKGHILPHAEWEEKVLYPVIDQKTGGGKYAFTAAMRHEHRIVERWIDQLACESGKENPDTKLSSGGPTSYSASSSRTSRTRRWCSSQFSTRR